MDGRSAADRQRAGNIAGQHKSGRREEETRGGGGCGDRPCQQFALALARQISQSGCPSFLRRSAPARREGGRGNIQRCVERHRHTSPPFIPTLPLPFCIYRFHRLPQRLSVADARRAALVALLDSETPFTARELEGLHERFAEAADDRLPAFTPACPPLALLREPSASQGQSGARTGNPLAEIGLSNESVREEDPAWVAPLVSLYLRRRMLPCVCCLLALLSCGY